MVGRLGKCHVRAAWVRHVLTTAVQISGRKSTGTWMWYPDAVGGTAVSAHVHVQHVHSGQVPRLWSLQLLVI